MSGKCETHGQYLPCVACSRQVDKDRITELEGVLTQIANYAHHGGLLEGDPYYHIRKLSLPYWDKDACSALQQGKT